VAVLGGGNGCAGRPEPNPDGGTDIYLIGCFLNDTVPTEIYTLSLHDALPIYAPEPALVRAPCQGRPVGVKLRSAGVQRAAAVAHDHLADAVGEHHVGARQP